MVCVTPSARSTQTAPRVSGVSRVCAPKCVTVTRTVSLERSVSRPRVGWAAIKRRIVTQEKCVKMENVSVASASSILLLVVLTSMSVKNLHVTPAPSAPTLLDHSSVPVLED